MADPAQIVVLTRVQLDELLDEAIARAKRLVEDDWCGPDEVAKILSVSRESLPRLVRRDGLPCYRAGRNYTFRRSEVLGWLEQRAEGVRGEHHMRKLRRLNLGGDDGSV